MSPYRPPADGDTRKCPQCQDTLVFTTRHPVLSVGMALARAGSDASEGTRYERAWVCRSERCDYRELMGD